MALSEAAEIDGRRRYTAAMVAQIVGVPPAAVRRWTRRGYLSRQGEDQAASDSLGLYGFDDVRAAQMLTQMRDAGMSLDRIDVVIDQLLQSVDSSDRALCEWDIAVEEGTVVVRREGRRLDPTGQRLLDFPGASPENDRREDEHSVVIPLPSIPQQTPDLRAKAEEFERAGDSHAAIEAYRALLLSGQGTAEDHFALAQVLYRTGDLPAARERLMVCLESAPEHVEARVSLGCVYAESGELDLAEAALLGALDSAPNCPEALFNLAEVSDQLGCPDRAVELRQRLVSYAPEGPWLEETRALLDQDDD